MQDFLDTIYGNYKHVTGILVILVLALSLPITVALVQNYQDIRQFADSGNTPSGCFYSKEKCFQRNFLARLFFPCNGELVCQAPTQKMNDCVTRPACLDAYPHACKIPEPAEGWCPMTPSPTDISKLCIPPVECPAPPVGCQYIGVSSCACGKLECQTSTTCTPRPACVDWPDPCDIAEPPGGWCPAATPQVCIQIITSAQNPTTGECREFSTPCDVPPGWTQGCSASSTSSSKLDVDKNGSVNLLDFNLLRSCVKKKITCEKHFDLNGDGSITREDLSSFTSNFPK